MTRRIDITVADGETVLLVVNGDTGFPITVKFVDGIVSAFNGDPDEARELGDWL
jgi:hypothetical protein